MPRIRLPLLLLLPITLTFLLIPSSRPPPTQHSPPPGRRIGLVGDSLSENLVMAVALLCTLRAGYASTRKWEGRDAWRGGYFTRENVVVVAYHRAVLLAKYTVDADIPAVDWVKITNFYDVLIFNTGHWWGPDKFPKETPLVFYRGGKPMEPPLSILYGLKVVLKSMAWYIEREVPGKTLKLWRSHPGTSMEANGITIAVACQLASRRELHSWFDPRFGGVNKEVRLVNSAIQEALVGTDIQLINLTYMSEFRADAHPDIWLGKNDVVAVWGQDCMHWCVRGVPDTWVNILAAWISHYFMQGDG